MGLIVYAEGDEKVILYEGRYGGFAFFRARLSKALGFYEVFERVQSINKVLATRMGLPPGACDVDAGEGDWPDPRDESTMPACLREFLTHSDCDGSLSATTCGNLYEYLDAKLRPVEPPKKKQKTDDEDEGEGEGEWDQFLEGLKYCRDNECKALFR